MTIKIIFWLWCQMILTFKLQYFCLFLYKNGRHLPLFIWLRSLIRSSLFCQCLTLHCILCFLLFFHLVLSISISSPSSEAFSSILFSEIPRWKKCEKIRKATETLKRKVPEVLGQTQKQIKNMLSVVIEVIIGHSKVIELLSGLWDCKRKWVMIMGKLTISYLIVRTVNQFKHPEG